MFGLKKRVEKGAKLLDVFRPGWHQRIDIDKLNMSLIYDCILGQVYGSYAEGIDRLLGYYADDNEITSHGFDLVNIKDRLFHSYGGLRKAWIKEIQKRKANG